MDDRREPHVVPAPEEMRALAHPMRQRILSQLHDAGPATSTTLARELGENSGITSYHLRQLAEQGFVRELTGRGRDRERWWEASPKPAWISRESLTAEAQAELSGPLLPHLAGDLDGFRQFRATRADLGEWGRGTWVSGRTTLTLTRDQTRQLIADYQDLINRYKQSAADPSTDTRTVIVRVLTYPRPTVESTGP